MADATVGVLHPGDMGAALGSASPCDPCAHQRLPAPKPSSPSPLLPTQKVVSRAASGASIDSVVSTVVPLGTWAIAACSARRSAVTWA